MPPPFIFHSSISLPSLTWSIMFHSDFPDTSASRGTRFTENPATAQPSSWSFDPLTSEAEARQPEVTTYYSIIPPSASPSRVAFASNPSPPVHLPSLHSPLPAVGNESAPSPPPLLFNLESSSSLPWHQADAATDEIRATSSRRRLPRVEKDVDDPSQAENSSARLSHNRSQSTTLTTLSRLFAAKASTPNTESGDRVCSNQSYMTIQSCNLCPYIPCFCRILIRGEQHWPNMRRYPVTSIQEASSAVVTPTSLSTLSAIPTDCIVSFSTDLPSLLPPFPNLGLKAQPRR